MAHVAHVAHVAHARICLVNAKSEFAGRPASGTRGLGMPDAGLGSGTQRFGAKHTRNEMPGGPLEGPRARRRGAQLRCPNLRDARRGALQPTCPGARLSKPRHQKEDTPSRLTRGKARSYSQLSWFQMLKLTNTNHTPN